jgi:hypothetical protein
MEIKAVGTPQAPEAARRVCAAKADAPRLARPDHCRDTGKRHIRAVCHRGSPHGTGIPTARGHRFWMAGPVRNLLNRLDRLSDGGALGTNERREGVRPPAGAAAAEIPSSSAAPETNDA